MNKSRINQLLKEFERYLLRRNKAEKTRITYKIAVEQFLTVTNKEPIELTENDFNDYEDFMIGKYPNTNSLTPKYGAVRTFLKKHLKIKLPDDDVLKPPEFDVKPKDILTEDEINQIILATGNNIRDKAIIQFLWYSMQRREALIGLNLNDINFQQRTVTVEVKGKGGKRRKTINLDDEALDSIRKYIKKRRIPKNSAEKAVFLNCYGNRIGVNDVTTTVKRYASKAGIEKKVSPHTFRTSSISFWHQQGKDLVTIAEQSGHKSLETIRRHYININPIHQRKTYEDAFHNNHEEVEMTKPIKTPEPKPTPKGDSPITSEGAFQLLMDGLINEDQYRKLIERFQLYNHTRKHEK